MPAPRRTLRARIAWGLLTYSVLLGAGILLQGYLTNEQIEEVLWRTLLTREAEQIIEHQSTQRQSPLPHTSRMLAFERRLDDREDAGIPPELARLQPGVHDDIELGGSEVAVLVRDDGSRRLYVAVDITDVEADEESLIASVFASSFLILGMLVGANWLLAGRMLRPISDFAAQFDKMRPEVGGDRVHVDDSASVEVATIAAAMNRYLDRQERFVVRERAFINTMSHELRTPVAVVRGAAEILGETPGLPEEARRPLSRIHRTLDSVEQLITMLLVLAREPDRFDTNLETIRLEALLPEIVQAHAHLTRDKDLRIELGRIEAGCVRAPSQVVETAVANLLRNAIENSDRGVIRIEVRPAGVVRILDPGHGMSPADISRLYSSEARADESRSGAGLGLELIRRMCEHLGWHLEHESQKGLGTLAMLDVRSSLVQEDPRVAVSLDTPVD